MELFSFWLGFVVIFYSAGSSVQASLLYKCRPVEVFVTTSSSPAQTTVSLAAFLSDIFKDKSPLSIDPKLQTELAAKIVKKYEEFLTDSFKDIVKEDVDLQGLTSELTKNLLELWSVYIKQIQGNYFEKAASIATRAKIVGVGAKYLYDIGSFENLDFISFSSDSRFGELFKLSLEVNNMFSGDIEASILNGKTAALIEKTVAVYIDAVKKFRKT